MNEWEIETDEDLIRFADEYDRINRRIMIVSLNNNETLPGTVRREIIAREMGVESVEEMMEIYERGASIRYDRNWERMSDEERASRLALRKEIQPLIEQAMAEHEQRKSEIEQLNKLFGL